LFLFLFLFLSLLLLLLVVLLVFLFGRWAMKGSRCPWQLLPAHCGAVAGGTSPVTALAPEGHPAPARQPSPWDKGRRHAGGYKYQIR